MGCPREYRREWLKVFFILLLFGITLSGCFGTDTGNPGSSNCLSVSAFPPVVLDTTEREEIIDGLMEGLCERVDFCLSYVTVDSCLQALDGSPGDDLAAQWTTATSEPNSLQSLKDGLKHGFYLLDSQALEICHQDMAILWCGLVWQKVGENFELVEELVPASCEGVFIEPEADPTNPDTSSTPC